MQSVTSGRHAVLALSSAVVVLLACDAAKPGSSPGVAVDTSHSAQVPDSLLITANGVGRIALGMTIDEARRAYPSGLFERISDGDGAALVEVMLRGGEKMTLYAGEDDPAAAIDDARRIAAIEVFTPEFRTADGVHPGSRVADLEARYGKVVRIVMSEIEARQYVTFERQPAGLLFRIDYTGLFPPDARVTTEYEPEAAIFSISVPNPESD